MGDLLQDYTVYPQTTFGYRSEHILSYAALKLDRLVANGSHLAEPKNHKLVLLNIATALDMNKSSAGKSALESAARVIADKGQLDRVENDSPKLKKRYVKS